MTEIGEGGTDSVHIKCAACVGHLKRYGVSIPAGDRCLQW